MRNKFILAGAILGCLIVFLTARQQPNKDQQTPTLGHTRVVNASGHLFTNENGEVMSKIQTTTEYVPIKDGDYEVIYVCANPGIKEGHKFTFGLQSLNQPDLDYTQLSPSTFTYKENTYFVDGYKVRVSQNGTFLEVIGGHGRGVDYKGPHFERPKEVKGLGQPIKVLVK